MVINLLVDISYAFLDPRIRYGHAAGRGIGAERDESIHDAGTPTAQSPPGPTGRECHGIVGTEMPPKRSSGAGPHAARRRLAPAAQEQAGSGRPDLDHHHDPHRRVRPTCGCRSFCGDPTFIDTTKVAQQSLHAAVGGSSLRHRQARARHRSRAPSTGPGSRCWWASWRWRIIGDHRPDRWEPSRPTTEAGGTRIIMRTADVFFAFPYILFAIVLIALLGIGLRRPSSSPSGCSAGPASPGCSAARSSP